MKKAILAAGLILIMLLTAACSTPANGEPSVSGPASGSGASPTASTAASGSVSPAAAPEDLEEVTGLVKTVNGDLVLIVLKDNGGEFMLRFSENTKWDEGVDRDIAKGSVLTCLIKYEPTFAKPSQGEVWEVIGNKTVR